MTNNDLDLVKRRMNEDREPADVTALFCIANELAQLNNSIKELIRTQKNRGL